MSSASLRRWVRRFPRAARQRLLVALVLASIDGPERETIRGDVRRGALRSGRLDLLALTGPEQALPDAA